MTWIRRKFVEILQSKRLGITEEAIESIALLYNVEKAARGKRPQEHFALREKDAKQVFDDQANSQGM